MTLPAEFSRLPKEWRVIPFLDAVADATGGNAKIKVEDYLEAGVLPIVDQGQRLFNGYTDDPTLACSTELPAIVFGDHTRCFKFIEVPFALGADGAKLLKPIEKFDPKFLYFYLNQLRIESAGYSRHYKFLKETYVPVPPLATQKHIALVLEQADQLRKQAQQMESELNQLAQSLFLEMFGDPVTNPKGWELKPIKDVATVTTGNTPSRSSPEYYGDHIEWIKSDNINTPYHYLTTAGESLSEEGAKIGRLVGSGAVLMTCIAGSPDCIGNVAIADRTIAFNQQINAVTPDEEKLTTDYFYMLCVTGKKLIQQASTNSMKGMVSKGNLEKVHIPVPPFDIQKSFARKFSKIRSEADVCSKQIVECEVAFNSLMQRAFNGELTAPERKAV